MNSEIKFRQRITLPSGEEIWHYWGWINNNSKEFVAPYDSESPSEQYIGSWDKKGTDIYINDIVELSYKEAPRKKKRRAIIEFVQTNLSFRACRGHGFIANVNNFEKYVVKVIGNVRENLDLAAEVQKEIKEERQSILRDAKRKKGGEK